MKLLFIINNWEEVKNTYMYTGYLPAIKRRSVEIELTQEQEKLIGIRNLVANDCHPQIEQIESISMMLEDKTKTY